MLTTLLGSVGSLSDMAFEAQSARSLTSLYPVEMSLGSLGFVRSRQLADGSITSLPLAFQSSQVRLRGRLLGRTALTGPLLACSGRFLTIAPGLVPAFPYRFHRSLFKLNNVIDLVSFGHILFIPGAVTAALCHLNGLIPFIIPFSYPYSCWIQIATG